VNRAEEAVRLITETPGITAAALAKAMMLGSPNYLYRVLPQLARDGKISKQGKGYHAVGSEA
jgi:predicted HTH transcriptional regulator